MTGPAHHDTSGGRIAVVRPTTCPARLLTATSIRTMLALPVGTTWRTQVQVRPAFTSLPLVRPTTGDRASLTA